MKTKYIIQDKETGTFIDEFTTMQDAENQLAKYEQEDREEGTFTPDFYEIVRKGDNLC